MYTSKQTGNKYIVSVKNHTEVVKALTAFCEEKNIKAGSIYGIGAVKEATLRFFDPATKKYIDKIFPEQMEIASLIGNIAQMHDQVYIHLHITLGRADYSALAGHLLSAVLNGAGEFVVEKYDAQVERHYDETTGINLYDL